MKIVYVMTRSDVIGGASVHMLDLAQGMQNAGHDVVILVGGHGIFLDRAKEKNLRCISLDHMVREISPITDFWAIFELRKTISAIKPDIVHLHSSKAGILGRLAARSLSIPVVFTAHGWAFTEGVSTKRRILYRLIERFMARFASRIITVSDYDRQLALGSGVGDGKLITTIHNGIPDFSSQGKQRRIAKHVRLMMVARFDDPKDQKSVLRALNELKHLNWELEFVGDGPLLESTKEMASHLGLGGRVIFSGACNDVPDKLAGADVFVLISNWEGLPLTVLEAMCSGLPVVASNVGGVSESIEDGETGYLIDMSDKQRLVEALAELIESAELREKMGHEGRLKYEREFTFNSMLRKTTDVYTSVLQG